MRVAPARFPASPRSPEPQPWEQGRELNNDGGDLDMKPNGT